MPLYEIDDKRPALHPSVYVAESADLIGQVELDEGCSVWSHVCIRADNEPVRIGARSNVQEGSVLHTDLGFPLTIGRDVTIGHQAMLHGCTIGDGALVGIQAVVLNGARIGRNCLVGAGALVTEGKEFPDGSMIVGAPARVVRQLTPEQIEGLRQSARHYVDNARRFQAGLKRLG